jgi:large subunit ribosomal protein L17
MRHRIEGKKLGRTTAHRRAMLANMAASLIMHDKIETTLPKAKELRCIADRLVTLSKRGTLAARRRAIVLIRNRKAVNKAFAELAGRFADRSGGYTRILKLGYRHGDSAPMAAIEYLSETKAAPVEAETKKTKKKLAKKAEEKRAEKAVALKKAAEKRAAPKRTGIKKAAARQTAPRKTMTRAKGEK